jgi:hypothetical protein
LLPALFKAGKEPGMPLKGFCCLRRVAGSAGANPAEHDLGWTDCVGRRGVLNNLTFVNAPAVAFQTSP